MNKYSKEQISILINLYSRLKNLIYDDIPKVVWEEKYNFAENQIPDSKVDRIMEFEPE